MRIERSVHIVRIPNIDESCAVSVYSVRVVKCYEASNTMDSSVPVADINVTYLGNPSIPVVVDRNVFHLDNGSVIIVLHVW